jgi:putative NADH-flavin reductase
MFGATGKIGRLLVEQALEQEYTVTAFAGNATKLTHSRLCVIRAKRRM